MPASGPGHTHAPAATPEEATKPTFTACRTRLKIGESAGAQQARPANRRQLRSVSGVEAGPVPARQIRHRPVRVTVMLTGRCRAMLRERCRKIASQRCRYQAACRTGLRSMGGRNAGHRS